MLALWLWITDVRPETAAMRVLPGSHRAIHAHWERTLQAERRAKLPRVHGLFPAPGQSSPGR
jgi:ectoine hydroxylase-related dioxygenase (phytanoyl-CoA dioxygenase family)